MTMCRDHNPRVAYCPFCKIAELELERDSLKEQIAVAENAGKKAGLEWISVDDRLPEIPCLTYWADGKVEAYDDLDTIMVDDLMDETLEVKMTHWMPLPEPPRSEIE